MDFWGSILGGSPKGRGSGTLELCQNICLLIVGWYKKSKTGMLTWAIPKTDF